MSEPLTREKMLNILNNLNTLENNFLKKNPDVSAFNDFHTYLDFLNHFFIQKNNLASIYFQQMSNQEHDLKNFWQSLEHIDEIYCILTGLDICIYKQFNFQNYKAHSESCFECIYIMKGSGTFKLSSDTFNLYEGDFIFHQPGEKYLLVTEPDSIVINLELRSSYIYKNYQQLFVGCPAALLFFDNCYKTPDKHNYLLFHTDNQQDFQDIILSMFAESLQTSSYKNNILKTYFELFINYLKRYGSETVQCNQKVSSKEFYYNEIVNYLHENYRTASLKNVAEKFHLSPNYISRIIRTKTGNSFVNTLTGIRLVKVKEYLSETDLLLEDIAELTGFRDASYLWRIFKKQTGLSPSNYRTRS